MVAKAVFTLCFAAVTLGSEQSTIQIWVSGPPKTPITLQHSDDLVTWSTITNFSSLRNIQGISFPATAPAGSFRAIHAPNVPFRNYGHTIITQVISMHADRIHSFPDTDVANHDSEGIRMYREGWSGTLYNHAVLQAFYGIGQLNGYLRSGDTNQLLLAEKYLDRLVSYAVESDGAFFYPYRFRWGTKQNPLDNEVLIMTNAWYSAMAQGAVLSLSVGLYETTQNPRYVEIADKTWRSFLAPAVPNKPWVTAVDETGSLWFEEYAQDVNGKQFVLNGHIFALWGLFDYYRTTHDATALQYLQGALATVKDWGAFFRTPNFASKYSIFNQTPDKDYHTLHMEQLLKVYEMTGDSHFAKLVDAYARDFPDMYERGTATLFGGITGMKIDLHAGNVFLTRSRLFTTNVQVNVFARNRFPNFEQNLLLISSGDLEGYYVRETPESAWQNGIVQPITFNPARKLTLRPGYPDGQFYKFDENGIQTEHTTRAIGGRIPFTARFDRTAIIKARRYVRICEGEMAGYWTPASERAFFD